MSAFRMLARVGNRPPPSLPVSRAYGFSLLRRTATPLRARVIVSTASSGSSPFPAPSPPCPTSAVYAAARAPPRHPQPLTYSAQLARLSTATYYYSPRTPPHSLAAPNPRNLTSVNTDSQPASQPANQLRRATIINYCQAGRLRGKDRALHRPGSG